ncbi:MAG: hypothetical protein ACFFB0_06740 [Promethearchaeota archaeon]
MGLWNVIAKTELKRRTSKFRGKRLLFFAILYIGLLIWGFFLAPLIFDSFMPTLAESETIQPYIIPAVALIIEYILMIFFLILILYPLNFIYRRSEIGHKEMILAAPITPGDIFLGEFIGKLPFMLLYVLGLTPAVVGLINPLINLNFLQTLVIYIDIFGMCIFALLIGSILSSWIEHKIADSEKYRDLAKALLIIMSVGMVALIYSLQYLFKYLMDNPELRNWLSFYPAQWFSNIILYILDPSLLDSYILNIWISLGLVITVPLFIFYLSYKKADSFYSLEGGIEKVSASTIIEGESKFYGFFRKFIGNKWEGLVIVQFKEFFRKKENIMKFIYVIGIISFFSLVYPLLMPDIEDVTGQLITKAITTLMRIFMGGFMLSIILGNYIFVGSKDLLWVYKKSPRHINGLVYSYLFSMIILIILMDIGFTIVFSIFLEFEIIDSIVSFVSFFLSGILAITLTVGVQCFRPAFEEKGKNMGGNIFMTIAVQLGQLIVFIFLIIEIITILPTSEILVNLLLAIFLGIQAIVTIPIFIFGFKRLKRIE